ncbi:MAG: LysR family transcriptional regulator [Alphaproteobacteria bacterium]|nr:LysR family transcriptional regulator [Alphaproteobacteria bacterium]MCY4499886.1 LysR family transcriptional regulator [Rhodospirillaceae bacterium]
MDWDKLRIFHSVADAGSFTHAGETLNLSQSAVSRQIGALEENLGVMLFHRHARGLILTEQGETLYRTAHDVSARLAMTEAMITDAAERPRGELKVTTTVGFGSTWLTPRIREFTEHYPDVTLHLILDDRELDLGMREADIAIRMHEPIQGDLVKRKLVRVHRHIYASPEYLSRNGTPATIEDLADHKLIVYGEEAPTVLADVNWLLTLGDKGSKKRLNPTLKVNNIYGTLLAVESGVGIAGLPDYIVQGHSRVTRIIPEVEGPAFDTFFVYPEELRHSKRVAIFRDFLVRKVQGERF